MDEPVKHDEDEQNLTIAEKDAVKEKWLPPAHPDYPNLHPIIKNDPRFKTDERFLNNRPKKGRQRISFQKIFQNILNITPEEFCEKTGYEFPQIAGAKTQTVFEALIAKMVTMAMSSDGKRNKTILPVVKLLLDRLEGLPMRHVNITGGVEHNLRHYREQFRDLEIKDIKIMIGKKQEQIADCKDIADVELIEDTNDAGD